MRTLIKLYSFLLILAFNQPVQAFAQNPTIIINELMINPNNVASLPPFEYIELYNNSSQVIDLKNIVIHVNSNQQQLPTYKLAPRQYVILCQETAATQFSRYGNAIALARWSALNNSTASIKLTQEDVLLDEVTYRDSWYNNSSKRNGGWSLERINPNWNCNINLNWSATNSLSGGTPGKNNTILDQKFIPKLHIINYAIYQNIVELEFNIASNYLSNIDAIKVSLDGEIGVAPNVEIKNDKIQISFPATIDPQMLYTIKISGLKICDLEIPSFETKLFKQNTIAKGDIIINEVLFNPKEGGVDFVELYNNSSYPINLQNFRLGNRIITNQFYVLEADGYVAITTDKSTVYQHYPNAIFDNLLETSALPPYTNQQGNVTLYSDQNTLIDSIYYNSSMHSAHLIDAKGVSLERITIDKNTLQSASTLHGGATPGYRNSVVDIDIPQNKITLTSKTFSPNGDGFEDELEINYALIKPNYIITIEIYNDKRQLIRKLAHQNLAGTHGKLIWDGKNDSGIACAKGHYICFAQIFNLEGKKQKFKQPFVLINSLARH